jgi:heavy metal efflux system protein
VIVEYARFHYVAGSTPWPVPPGLLPVALATGVGTDSQRPFAQVIVSGLFTRLPISVFLMPALYTLVGRPGDRLEV